MDNNTFRIVCQTLFVVIVLTCNFSTYGCKKKSEIELLEEQMQEIEKRNAILEKQQIRIKAMEKKITDSYCSVLTKKILGEHMNNIDSIIIESTNSSGRHLGSDYSDKYDVVFSASGTAYGELKGTKDAYIFFCRTFIAEDDIDSMIQKRSATLNIFDKDGHFVYNSRSDVLEKLNQAIKKRRANAEERI